MESTLDIIAIGRPRVRLGGNEVRFRTQKARDIVLFVAFEGSVSRERIGQEFWPELPPEDQRKCVRQELTFVRRALGEALRESGGQLSVVGARIEGDWMSLEPDEVPSAVEGGFLPGLDYDWASSRRRLWEQKIIDGTLGVAENCIPERPDAALRLLDALGRLDPYLEKIPLLKAAAWDSQNSHVKARAVILQYAQFIKGELGMDVEAELLEQMGWPRSSESESPTNEFAALSPSQAARLAIAHAPGWLARSQLQLGRARLELALKQPGLSPSHRADLWFWLSRLSAEGGDLADALECARSLVGLARSRRHVALAHLAVARATFFQAPFAELRAHCEAALSARRQLDPEFVVEAHVLLGTGLYFENRLAEASSEVKRALRLCGQAGLPFQEVLAVSLQGSLHFKSGEFDQARKCFERACAVGRDHGIGIRTGHAYSSLGRVLEAVGDSRSAFRCYEEAQRHYEGREARHPRAIVLSYLGDLHMRSGELPQALAAHRLALAERRLCGETRGLATSTRCLARCHLSLGEFELAERRVRESHSLSTACSDELGAMMSLVILAHLRRAEGRVAEAIPLAKKALDTLASRPEFAPIPGTEDPIYTLEGIQEFIAEAVARA
ncbi:MAG: hypothetical protein HND43_09395 [Armatimonadetes bacterium]|nr:hypothetical protein [Armatimonadota bacterium]NOG39591.1 hypothetical protein [Armatimonadota bacterium]GIK33426.1 MAG: hypothetical protein BroJett009_24180 [Armatimonadota bacterium]